MSTWDSDLRPFRRIDGRLIFVPTGLVVLAEHLGGKHDQKLHGRGGRGVISPSERSPALEAALRAHESRIKGIVGGEEAVVLDAQGNVVLSKRAFGDPDGDGPATAGVSFGKHEYVKFKGNVMTHNHPSGTQGLSTDDISTAVNDQLAEMRTVNKNGVVYSLRPGSTTWSPEHLAKVAPVWDKHFKAVDDKNRADISKAWKSSGAAGINAAQRASDSVFHEVLTKVAAEVGWDYQVIVP